MSVIYSIGFKFKRGSRSVITDYVIKHVKAGFILFFTQLPVFFFGCTVLKMHRIVFVYFFAVLGFIPIFSLLDIILLNHLLYCPSLIISYKERPALNHDAL